MSGGIAFVLDEFAELEQRCNSSMVELTRVTDPSDRRLLRQLLEQHARYTGSARAKRELARWEASQKQFFAVVPHEYKRALERQAEAAAASAMSDDVMRNARRA